MAHGPLVLAHGCITMRRCVVYIYDPDTTLNFDLKVKFIGFLTCFCVQPITFFGLTLVNHIWHMGEYHKTICILYIPNPDLMLTFDLKVKL